MTKLMSLGDIDLHIGTQLRARRMVCGLSQTALADKCGVSFQQIQKYERGINRVSGSRMYQLCQLLDVEPNYFFQGLESPEGSWTMEKSIEYQRRQLFLFSEGGNRMITAYLELPPEVRAETVHVIEAIARAVGSDKA